MNEIKNYKFAEISQKASKEISQLEDRIKQDTNKSIVLIAYEQSGNDAQL